MKKICEDAIARGEIPKETLRKLSKELDRGREVGIQEAVYRALGLSMVRFSSIVKFINTNHPERREGLLKSAQELSELSESESVFHKSLHDYYMARPLDSDDDDTDWTNMCLAKFVANYDVDYSKPPGKNSIKLRNKKGYIKRRSKECVIRYFLKHENKEEYYRALCVLFLPFRNEMEEIHSHDVESLYAEHQEDIDELRRYFEKNVEVLEMLRKKEAEKPQHEETDDEDEFVDDETTDKADIEDFINSARNEAKQALHRYNEGVDRMSNNEFLEKVSKLNSQQAKIFNDFCERIQLSFQESDPFYLYIKGEAGTGKSFLLRLMIEFVNRLPKSSGQELDKPVSLTIAPTGVAAYLVNGVTIESGLGMMPQQNSWRYYQNRNSSATSNLRFLYQDLRVIFLDEVSMVSSDKLTIMNFRLQEILGNTEFMGGVSVVCTGDFGQLPPVKGGMIWNNSNIDNRLDISPNHWNENFTITHLTEKMRSKDQEFSRICDKVKF